MNNHADVLKTGLPVNPEAERLVLGSVMLNEAVFVQLAERLESRDFALEKHRRIFSRMKDLFERGEHIDRITVADELNKHKQLESVGGLAYLVSLDDGLPEIVNIDSYIRIVKDKATLRKIIFMAQEIINQCLIADQEPSQVIAGALDALRDLEERVTDEGITNTRTMIETEGPKKIIRPLEHGTIHLPIAKLDEVLRGFTAGQMIVLMARTSRGKSSLAYQIAMHAAEQQVTPVIWTLEMSPREAFQCIAQQISGVWPAKYQLTFEEEEELGMAVLKLYENQIYFDERAHSVSQFVARLRRVQQRAPIGLAVVDHLQLIRGGSHRNRVQEVSDNSRALKTAAMELGIPFLVLSQVDRASVKGDGKIGLHSGKESGDIENDADVVLWIDSEEEFSWDRDTLASLTVGKNRMGRAGVKIPLLFRPSYRAFLGVVDA